jgi:hypothetical protein
VEDCNKILGALFECIPMPTAEEQRALQLENAKDDVKFWDMLGDMYADRIEGHKVLVAGANKRIAEDEAEKAKAADDAATAKERLAKIERGEDVPGLGHPVTREQLEAQLIAAGWTRAELRHMHTLVELPEEAIPIICDAGLEAGERAGPRKAGLAAG